MKPNEIARRIKRGENRESAHLPNELDDLKAAIRDADKKAAALQARYRHLTGKDYYYSK
jgi:hypothetical protein